MPFPIEEKYIVQTEAKLNVTFPESYKKKMQIENGGEIQTPPDSWLLYPFFDKSNKKRLKRTANDICRETKQAMEWEGFPQNAICIGSNGCGDQLVFVESESQKGLLGNEVFWWDHETANISKIANDFSELS